jgi:membrane fusion protein, heavy metal efflux system
MNKFLFGLLLTQTFSAFALDNQIRISQEQIDNLDIKVAALNASHQVPLFFAPAKVVVPADKEVLISSSQPGLVAQLPVNIGDRVSKGQLLAQLNSPSLVGLQQAFLTANNDLNLYSLEQRRDQKLWQEGAIAERRWQETQMMHGNKSAKADEARQLLALAGMSAAEIKQLAQTHKLDDCLTVRSPINGVVLERLATLGARLDIQAPLYRIADLSELWLEINVPQERLNSLHLGDQVRLENSDIAAKLTLLGQSVNRDNQTVLARAVIDGKSSGLRVGQNVNVQVMQNSTETGFKVPNTAIAQNEGHAYVFVRNGEGFAVTEVTVSGKQDAESLISGPLTGNEQIAIKGAVALKANWLGLGGAE